jgi:hypothetical protein
MQRTTGKCFQIDKSYWFQAMWLLYDTNHENKQNPFSILVPILSEHKFLLFSFFWFIYLFSFYHVHTLFGSFLHPASLHPLIPPSPPQFQADPVLPLWLILLKKKRHKHNKKDKAFLLVELRIAIQKDSYYCSHVQMCYDPCWFNSNWSLHWFLIPC